MSTASHEPPPPSLLDGFGSEEELDAWLTRPRAELVDFIKRLSSPLVILGAGGKMGPTLALLARRAAVQAGQALEIWAVSRFSDAGKRAWLEAQGVKTLSCDLLDAGSLRRLPDTENLLYLVGLKFGTTQNPALTWAVNTLAPAHVVARYPQARIVALSTGNVYPLSSITEGGSVETDPLTPVGEYANAAVARERIFEYGAACHGTRIALLRLFYAVEVRYGVIADLAQRVFEGSPIPLSTGRFNCIWQGDANAMILRALSLTASPPTAWNLCCPVCFSVREVATLLGRELGREPRFTEVESPAALLGNAERICRELGEPSTAIETIVRWVAAWVKRGGRSLGKPTHFEVRDGRY